MARITKPLTDKEIKGSKAREKEYKLFDGGRLYLSITPTSKKWWRLKYTFDGKEKRISLGVYPMVSLQEARKKREDLKYQIAQGVNPAQERKDEKENVKEEETQKLTQLRDWLLPMLMNGQVSVADATEQVEELMVAEPSAEYGSAKENH